MKGLVQSRAGTVTCICREITEQNYSYESNKRHTRLDTKMNQPTGRWQTSSEGHKFSSRNKKITFRRRLSKEEKCGLEFGFWKSARNGGMKVSRPLKVRLFPNPGKCQPSRSVARAV